MDLSFEPKDEITPDCSQRDSTTDKNKKMYNEFRRKSYYEKVKFILTKSKPDCSFVFESTDSESPQKRLYSYKWILSAVSPVFEAMFNGNFKESSISSMDIKIDDISYEDFESFLNYIYYGKDDTCEWPEECWEGLLYITSKYMIEEMRVRVRWHIATTAEPINSFKYRKANNWSFTGYFRENILRDPRLGEFDLKSFIEFMEFLNLNLTHFNDDNVTMKYKMIEAYIKQRGYNNEAASESKVVVNINEGDPHEEDSIEKSPRDIVQSLLNFINFDKMSVKQFLEGPDTSNLLSIKKKYSILRRIIKKTTYAVRCYEHSGCVIPEQRSEYFD